MEIGSRKAVLGIYFSISEAEAAIADLRRAGLRDEQIGLVVRGAGHETGHIIVAATPATAREYVTALAILRDRRERPLPWPDSAVAP